MIAEVFRELGLEVFERGWLSSNNVVFRRGRDGPLTVVDTGYASHAEQTLSLLRVAAGTSGVERVVNTHLHSDHCGGNAALQAAWDAPTWIPAVSLDAVRDWDASRLTYAATGQRCDRFVAAHGIEPGQAVVLGNERWQAFAVSGHDPEALMFFHPSSRVLITADALWESRLAIIFPELDGRSGFAEARSSLDTIEALEPRIVIPGHGAAFTDVSSALASSRRRIARFESDPALHTRYAARALTMFRMLDIRSASRGELERWLAVAPIFARMLRLGAQEDPTAAATALIDSLVADGLLLEDADGVLRAT